MNIIFNSQFHGKDWSSLWKMFLVKQLHKSDLKDIFVVQLLVLPISDYQLLGAKEECTSSIIIALHVEATGHSIKWDCFLHPEKLITFK